MGDTVRERLRVLGLLIVLAVLPAAAWAGGRVIARSVMQDCDYCCSTYNCRGGPENCITVGEITCYKGGQHACPPGC